MNYQRIYNELITNRKNNLLPKDINTPKNIGKLHYKINNEEFNFIREDGETFSGIKYDLFKKFKYFYIFYYFFCIR